MTDAFWWPDHELSHDELPHDELPHDDAPHGEPSEAGAGSLPDPAGHAHLPLGPAEEAVSAAAGLHAYADEPGGWAPYDGGADVAPPESLHDMVYGTSGLDGVAHDLWSQLLPGVPVPSGLDGAGLTGADLLAELRERVHDPMLANVIDSMLAEWRG